MIYSSIPVDSLYRDESFGRFSCYQIDAVGLQMAHSYMKIFCSMSKASTRLILVAAYS